MLTRQRWIIRQLTNSGAILQEKAIYEQILADPDTVVKGTVKELADKYGVEVLL